MSDLEELCECLDQGPRPSPCAKCGRHVLYSVREGLRAPAPFELELDPYERIERAAAEWRNAYRAFERNDRAALIEHSFRAVHHTLVLSQGLR